MDHRVPIQDETAAIKVTVESVSFFKDLAFRTRCKKKGNNRLGKGIELTCEVFMKPLTIKPGSPAGKV